MAEREPTIGEVHDDVKDLAVEVRRLADRMEDRFLSKELYAADQRTDAAEKAALKAEQDRQAEAVRWLGRGLVVNVLFPLAVLAIWYFLVKGVP